MAPEATRRGPLADLPTVGLLAYRCLLLLLLSGILLVELQAVRASGRPITVGELRRLGEKANDERGRQAYRDGYDRTLAVEVQGYVTVDGEVEVKGTVTVDSVDGVVTVDGDVNCN